MSVKIRMKRMGSKKRPFYRIVVADSRSPRDGRFIEELGYYNPIDANKTFVIDEERATYWAGTGAKPSETVEKLLKKSGMYDAVFASRKPVKKAAVETQEPQETQEVVSEETNE